MSWSLRTPTCIATLVLLANLLGILASPASAIPLQCQVVPQLFEVYLKYHYANNTLSEDVKKHTVEQFIKSIDPTKTLLLEGDVTKLRSQLPSLFSLMRRGDCHLLTDANALLVARAKEDEIFMKKFLDDDYKLDERTELVTDPEKRGYARTTGERMELLKKMAHFQISNYLLTNMTLAEAKKSLIHRYELIAKRLSERRLEDELQTYAGAFARSLDPHSDYLSPETMEDFRINMGLSLEGIGASLSSQDGFTVIEELIPGGSAERVKLLRPKDKIIAVAQEGERAESIIDMDLREVVKKIRGKKGTKVTLTILRQGEETETFEVTILRDKIDIKEQAAKITYEKRKAGDRTVKVGVIDLPSFYGTNEDGGRSAYRDVKKLLEEARAQEVEGILLNLSQNGGGLLDQAVTVAGLFIRKGGVVATQSGDKKVEVLADEDDDVAWSGPLVVLTSRLSASASEILAGALRDYRRAVVVGGDHTFGKGTVQMLADLPMGLGAMKVTTGMYFLPGGASTQQGGVPSDIQIPSVLNNKEVGEKTMDYSLPPQTIKAFLSPDANGKGKQRWQPVNPSLLPVLAQKSRERVSKEPKFAEVRKEIEEAAKNKGVIRLADIRKKAEAENMKDKHKEKTSRNARTDKLDDLTAPVLAESVSIVADLVVAAPAQ